MKEMALPEVKSEFGCQVEEPIHQESMRDRSVIEFDPYDDRYSHFSFPQRKNRTGPIGWTARD